MKIVQLCPYDMRRPGGVQRHVRDLSDWLTAQGHETRIIAPPAPGAAPRSWDRITEVGRARRLAVHGTAFELSLCAPGTARRLATELQEWGADIVHMHTPWTPMLVGQMWRALRLPTVTTFHATLPRNDGASLTDRYIRKAAGYFLRRSQAVVVPSEAPLPLLRQLVPGLDATVLPPAIDLSDWRAARRTRRPNDPLHMVFLGRLEARKGVDVVLDAWRILALRLPDVTLTIAGEGALQETVEKAVRAQPDGRLHYVGRPDDAAAQALIGSADLLLAPAPYGESFGLVLAEAMSAGTVPVAAANDGYAQVLTGPGVALLVPPDDATALAAKVELLTRDASQHQTQRNWAMGHATSFDIKAVGPRYLDLFDRVLRPHC